MLDKLFQNEVRTISQKSLAFGVIKLFSGLLMLRLPDLAYYGDNFSWPMVLAGVLLITAGIQHINLAIGRGGDLQLMLFVHRFSRMRLANRMWQWGMLAILMTAMAMAVFTLLYANSLSPVGQSALIITLLTPFLNLLARIAVRIPMYLPSTGQPGE